jgi:hypothetical protein
MTTIKYKLLKALPIATIGAIFERDEDNKITFQPFTSSHDDQFTIANQYWTNILFTVLNDTDWFEPIPEPKTQHFYKNGSVCEVLENGTKYFYQDFVGMIEAAIWDNVTFDITLLANHNVFLTKEACQKAIDERVIYNKLYLKVKQIDAENGFRVEWGIKKEESNWYIYKSHHTFNSKVNWVANWHTSESQQSGQLYHSEQSADYLLSTNVTDAQRKIWSNY